MDESEAGERRPDAGEDLPASGPERGGGVQGSGDAAEEVRRVVGRRGYDEAEDETASENEEH